MLKTSEEDTPKSMSHFVHQAAVQKSVVVPLILSAKERGHRAYRPVDMGRVSENGKVVARGWGPT